MSVGSVINLSEKIFSLTYGITAGAAFGGKCQDQQTLTTVVKEGIEATGGFDVTDVFPSVKPLQVISGMRPKLEEIHKRIDRVLESIVDEHKAHENTKDCRKRQAKMI